MDARGIIPRRSIRKVILLSNFLLILFAVGNGCGGGEGGLNPNLSAQAVTTTLGELQVGTAAPIPLGGGSAEILFEKLSGRERFILVASSSNKTGGSFAFGLTGSKAAALPASEELLSDHAAIAAGAGEDPTSRFHEFLRKVEQSLPPVPESDTAKYMESAWKEASVGERVALKVLNRLNSSESYTAITAEVRYVTAHFIVYVDVAALNALNDSELRSLVDPFEARVEEEYAVFGQVSDRDQNGKVAIVLSPVLNGMGGGGGVVTGFFFSGDLYPDRFAAANGGEYIYCHVPDETGQWGVAVPKDFYLTNTGPLCFPHELQHAIHFNQKVFLAGGAPDPPPFNEGLSHLAEDLSSGFAKASVENPSRIDLYFLGGLPSFTGGISLAERGGAYLFFRYLYEQADLKRFAGLGSGRDLIRGISSTSRNGFEAVEETTREQTAGLLGDFFSALYLSNTGLTADPRLNFRGISLRGSQDDNRLTVLEGPPVSSASAFPLSESVFAASARYKEITGELLLQSGSSLTISMDPASAPGATLIRIEDE